LVPQSLQNLVTALINAVQTHPQHALLPFQRHMIYDYFGKVAVVSSRRRRGWLAIITAERVLPLWQQARPQDNQAEQLLVHARLALRSEDDLQFATTLAGDVWNWFMNDYGDRRRFKEIQRTAEAFYVLAAAVQALLVAAGKDNSEGCVDQEDDTDADVDAWSTDAAGWAIAAFAGPTWEQDSDNAKRLEFWTWWLATAVPTAWEAAT